MGAGDVCEQHYSAPQYDSDTQLFGGIAASVPGD